MSKNQWGPDRKLGRVMLLGLLALAGAVALALAVAACAPSGPVEPIKSPRQLWIEAHPTHAGPNGECVEADDELCDEDPHDLDDMDEYDKHGYSKAASPKPSRSKIKPTPAPARSR